MNKYSDPCVTLVRSQC